MPDALCSWAPALFYLSGCRYTRALQKPQRCLYHYHSEAVLEVGSVAVAAAGGLLSAPAAARFAAACAAAEPMIAFIHLPMVRYVVPGGGAHAEEEAAAAASVAGGLLILAKNDEGDCIIQINAGS